MEGPPLAPSDPFPMGVPTNSPMSDHMTALSGAESASQC